MALVLVSGIPGVSCFTEGLLYVALPLNSSLNEAQAK